MVSLMDYRQMERHFRILQTIDRLKQYLRDLESGDLRATRFEGLPRSNYCKTDRIGETVVSLEKMQLKLKQLEEIENQERPDVEDTIRSLAGMVGKGRIRAELILTMRYLNGRDLEEIANILRIKTPGIENIIMRCFDRYEEGNGGN